ncbi:MAG: mechanosensitive ion channel family protein [Ignavibacteriae bacterium]|nr:mechanosensitive ion channel family protein [Ignavibacteriota bacterium]
MYHLILAIVIVAVFYLLSGVVRKTLRFIGRKVFSRTQTVLDDKILAVLLANVTPLMLIVALHIAVREVRKVVMPGDETAGQILDYADSLLYIVLVLLAVKILVGIFREIIDWYLERISAEGSINLKMTLGPLTAKGVNILVGLVAIIVILDHFGVNIGNLLVSLGVGSLAVALAAQDTLANMIAGFVILVDRPFRVGDRIELAGDQIGDVQEIGLRSTKLLNFDNNLIIIPNADMVKGHIVNYAYPFNQMRVVLKVGVAYGTNPEKVRAILLRLADAHPDILKDPAPEVFFTAMDDSAIEFTLMARVDAFSKRFKTETHLREQAYLAFAKEGIEIPFPQRVVHMKANA